VQPPGAHFDPPAALTMPNVDGLAPGEITELYSFDHDLGQFVAIGTGAVSADGTIIRSDPGVGIIKAGWHCGGNPTASGTSANCGSNNAPTATRRSSTSARGGIAADSLSQQCAMLNPAGNACVPNPGANGQPCNGDGNPCTEDVCSGGACSHNALTVTIGGPEPEYQNEFVNKDKPDLFWSDRQPLEIGAPLYAANPLVGGDMVSWKARVENVSYRNKVAHYTWWATGPQNHDGPDSASSKEWFLSSIDWKPGTYTIFCKLTFTTGCEKTATYTQEVGVRTDDIAVVGWINPAGVPLSEAGVSWQVLLFFPPEGLKNPPNPGQALLTLGYMGSLSAGATTKPMTTTPLTNVDCVYILNWMFKYAANDPPPDLLYPESVMRDFAGWRFNFKLYNRMQIKYQVAGSKISTYEFVHQQTLIGITNEPCFGAPDAGESGPIDGETGVQNGDTIYQVNEGSPDHLGVRAFNTLMFPREWSDIGSIIRQGLNLGTSYTFATQVYPTYFVYENGLRNSAQTHVQAVNPSDNFNFAPYPPNTSSAPFFP
jgi:hypothetical protein